MSEDPTRGPISYGREPWVEQVDFRVPEYNKVKKQGQPVYMSGMNKANNPLPSLDQISARLGSQGHSRSQPTNRDGNNRLARLPAFLAPKGNIGPSGQQSLTAVGRLQLPQHMQKVVPAPLSISLPKSPMSPNLLITTLVVPRSSTMSPTELSESNILALDSRERRAHNMLSTLKRRTLTSEHYSDADGMGDRKLKWKRHSAPADLLPLRQRTGFEHPVFSIPGGF